MYFQRHRPLGVKADVSIPMDTPQPQVPKKWHFKFLLNRAKAKYQAVWQSVYPDQACKHNFCLQKCMAS